MNSASLLTPKLGGSFDKSSSKIKKIQKDARTALGSIAYAADLEMQNTEATMYDVQQAITTNLGSSYQRTTMRDVSVKDLHYVDVTKQDSNSNTPNYTACSNNPTGITLNLAAQGNDITQRIGNKINLQSLEINWECFWNASSTLACSNVRIVVVYDSEHTGLTTLPNWVDVMFDTSAYTLPNVNTMDRFSIIYDEMFTVDPILRCQTRMRKISLKGRKTMFEANAGNNADFQSGSLFMYLYSDDTTPPNIKYQTRVAFTTGETQAIN